MLLEDIMVTQNIRLGPTELRLILTLEKEGKSIFRTDDAYRILNSTRDSVNTALYRLRKKGRIEEIERGKYLLIPARAGYSGRWSEMPFVIASKIVEPYYVGFWSALNYWAMTEQVPSVTFVVTTRRKRNLEYGQLRFKFVTLSKNRFFGAIEDEIGSEKFMVSSREKTVVDCLIYPKYCGGIDEIAKGIWESQDELDLALVAEYAERSGSDVAVRRFLYILEMLGIEKYARNNFKPNGFMWLDPNGPKKALGYSKRFGLAINRTKDKMMAWRGY